MKQTGGPQGYASSLYLQTKSFTLNPEGVVAAFVPKQANLASDDLYLEARMFFDEPTEDSEQRFPLVYVKLTNVFMVSVFWGQLKKQIEEGTLCEFVVDVWDSAKKTNKLGEHHQLYRHRIL
eukprot:TRINITY_DN4997_c0_g1_i2.p1 TRINITY_DN4997_c0_g1~~TRINITY_DN4997_c0_g1_i2.p1  ORF type:complete len:122 (+),score=20.28 TRINITY_DN4997_c0_g1_i2:150-515(+)